MTNLSEVKAVFLFTKPQIVKGASRDSLTIKSAGLKESGRFFLEASMNYNPEPPNTEVWAMLIMLMIVIVLCFLVFFIGKAHAQEVDIPKLADSIYLAEGGAKTSHPYGILAKYNHTTPRQACINTINHALRDFKGGDFIVFLGSRYCPPNAHPLNQNWIKNVRYFYERNKSKD